jgi:hypothetical protein
MVISFHAKNRQVRGLLGWFLPAVCSMAICSGVCIGQETDWSTRPHLERIGPNLAVNPSFDGSTGWARDGAVYDAAVTRTPGSGSMRLHATDDGLYTPYPSYVPVIPGETYTFAAYTMTDVNNGWPPPVVRMYFFYSSATGTFLGAPFHNGRWGNSAPGQWEEMAGVIEVPDQINGTPVEKLELWIWVNNAIDGVNRDIWIDDVYFGLGMGFEAPATPKTPFAGTQTRVDDLGNISVRRGGENWEPFFPLAMSGDSLRPDWSVYAQQGFNMEARAWSPDIIDRARAAGLMAGYDISRYMIPSNPDYNDLADLRSDLAEIEARGLADDMVYVYWDNEENAEWAVHKAVTDVIHQDDVGLFGVRRHPIFTLNGTIGHARRHNNDLVQMSDITGTYIGDDLGNARGRTNELIILDNIENQRQPAAIAQINRGVGVEMRPRLFGAIAHGARGLSFWKDSFGGGPNDVTNMPWWDEFPQIAVEIQQMLDAGLIQQPHWTVWTVMTTTKGIDLGTRDLGGEGYVIVANYNDTPTLVEFTIDGLSYTPLVVRDFFTDETLAAVKGGAFEVLLGANSSGAYRLVGYPAVLWRYPVRR